MHALLVAVLLSAGDPAPVTFAGACTSCSRYQREDHPRKEDHLVKAARKIPADKYQYRVGCGSAQRHCAGCRGDGPCYDFRREFDYPWFSPHRPQTVELYPPPPPSLPLLEEVPPPDRPEFPAATSSRTSGKRLR